VIKELQRVLRWKRWEEVVFCGFGEPLVRLDCVLEVAGWLGRFWGGVVRVNSNGHGYLLNKGRDVARELKEAGVHRVSVSLNAHDEDTYNEVCRPQFQNAFEGVLEFVEKAKKASLETEVTAVRIPEVDVGRVKKMAERMGVRFRVREYIPCIW
jgi:TatD family-associated radical SAM protein